MKYRLLDLLTDIQDGSQLRVESVEVQSVGFGHRLTQVKCKQFCGLKNRPVGETNVTAQDCMKCYSQEIVSGQLVSASGNRYPIVRGIPRLLAGETKGWVEKNQKTFSLEWKMFRFGERNWGQDIETRKALFLRAIGVKPQDLKGKLIFDAGCGSGLLSMELANSFGMEVVALDLAFGIEQAYAHNKNPFVYFIQGSVLEPPVKTETVDFLYCAGVLVALPDAKQGFKALKPVLKPGGRYFIWMYHPIDERHHLKDKRKMKAYIWIRKNVTTRLPIGAQHALFLAAIPFFVLKRRLLNLFRAEKDTRTWREKMQALTDMFSPVYQHRFTEEEIVEWFREEGLVNARTAYSEHYGFGTRGDMPAFAGKVLLEQEIR